MGESSLRDAIRDAVNATGLAWVEVNARGSRGRVPLGLMPAGSADLVGMLRGGRFVGLEVKVPIALKGGGKSTQEQRSAVQLEWAVRVRRMGGVCELVESVDEALDVVRRFRT